MARWMDRVAPSPIDWMMEKACPPIQNRVLTEILEKDHDAPEVFRAREGSMNYKPAVTISRTQLEGGSWLHKVIEFEVPNASRNRGPGMVNQYLALSEYTWDRTHPIIHCSAELLLRYLVEDPHADLFELKGYAGSNAEIAGSIRRTLANIAGALLSRSGYADEPAVVERAEKLLQELSEQYPEGGEPDLYDGTIEIEDDGVYRRVREGAHVPEMFLFYFLAFHPRFQADDARPVVQRVVDHMMKPDEIRGRIREAGGKRYLKLCDLHIAQWDQAQFAEGKLGFLLHDLELLARTRTLTTTPKARELLEWVLSLADAEDGVFRVDDHIEKVVSRSQYHYFPLEDSWRGKHKKYTDVTFRVLLILKILDDTGVDPA